jgi:sulfoxide reductase heme-binding subunit YedZ
MKYAIWFLLALPAGVIVLRFATGGIGYGETVHLTGQWSAGLLLAALAATPLRRIPGGSDLSRFLVSQRRAVGVAAFGYAALHLGVYLERKWGAGLIAREGLEPDLATGWIAFLVMLLLAVTSNNASVRVLGRRWKRLHRSVYLGAALTFAHWILATFDTISAYVCLVLLLLLEGMRLLPARS